MVSSALVDRLLAESASGRGDPEWSADSGSRWAAQGPMAKRRRISSMIWTRLSGVVPPEGSEGERQPSERRPPTQSNPGVT